MHCLGHSLVPRVVNLYRNSRLVGGVYQDILPGMSEVGTRLVSVYFNGRRRRR